MVAKLKLEGKVFNRLTVLRFAGIRRTSGKGTSIRTWECICDCGNKLEVDTRALTSGNTGSCGCYKLDVTTRHGMHQERIYQTWADMKIRCDNPKHKSYHRYGGRGISYQSSWAHFEEFLNDMSEGYCENLTLERIDPNGDYTKENCRWATKAEQSRNKGKDTRNKTGVTGVRTWLDKKTSIIYYVADAQAPDGTRMSKHFSTAKYGEEGAFNLAVNKRKEFIEILNKQGAGYGEFHGTDKEENI